MKTSALSMIWRNLAEIPSDGNLEYRTTYFCTLESASRRTKFQRRQKQTRGMQCSRIRESWKDPLTQIAENVVEI